MKILDERNDYSQDGHRYYGHFMLESSGNANFIVHNLPLRLGKDGRTTNITGVGSTVKIDTPVRANDTHIKLMWISKEYILSV